MSAAGHRYAAFGTSICSNRPLPDLPIDRFAGRAAITVTFGPWRDERPAGVPAAVVGPETLWRLPDGAWLLRHEHPHMDAAWTFRIALGGRRLDVRCREGGPDDDVAEVAQGTGVGACLNRMRRPALHACGVAVGDRALVLAGASGAGKSTIAAAFVAAGHALLSDDLAVLDRDRHARIVVHPGAPRLRLAAEPARTLGWDPAALAPVFRTGLGDKRRIPLSATDGTFCDEPRPLAAICLLERRSVAGAIEPVSPARAVARLVETTYAARLLDGDDRAELFLRYAEVAAEVPVLSVTPPARLGRLAGFLDALASRAA